MSHGPNKFLTDWYGYASLCHLRRIRNRLIEKRIGERKKVGPIIWEFHFHKMLFGENVGAIMVAAAATDDEPCSFPFES